MQKLKRTMVALGAIACLSSVFVGGTAYGAEAPVFNSQAAGSPTVVDAAGLEGQQYLAADDGSMTPIARPGVLSAYASGCSWTRMAVIAGGSWYTSAAGCSLIGATNTAAHNYRYEVDSNSKGSPCVQGRGYKKVGYSWSENYVALGCGKSGSKNVTIGNVITVAKVKAQSPGLYGTGLVFQ